MKIVSMTMLKFSVVKIDQGDAGLTCVKMSSSTRVMPGRPVSEVQFDEGYSCSASLHMLIDGALYCAG